MLAGQVRAISRGMSATPLESLDTSPLTGTVGGHYAALFQHSNPFFRSESPPFGSYAPEPESSY
jgi:hypothetical protein